MIKTVYIENRVVNHPRTEDVLSKIPHEQLIHCDSYKEIFNPKNQNFRLQKIQPSLIIASKTGERVLSAPEGYGIGGKHNYYFSHMLNCIYDCRYCFLQGMYPSANYVLFVNYEDFFDAIDKTTLALPKQKVWFFSGYDCDSLALDPITNFVSSLLNFLQFRPEVYVELRTKSTQIRALLSRSPNPNVVVAFSLSPTKTADHFEKKTPTIKKRLEAMRRLAKHGWLLGLRFDPLIFDDSFEERYSNLFREVFQTLPIETIHSVTLGVFRMPKRFFQSISNLYPEEPLFSSPLSNQSSLITYDAILEKQLLNFCMRELTNYIEPERVFSCEIQNRKQLDEINYKLITKK